jgi:hypothetical protein
MVFRLHIRTDTGFYRSILLLRYIVTSLAVGAPVSPLGFVGLTIFSNEPSDLADDLAKQNPSYTDIFYTNDNILNGEEAV